MTILTTQSARVLTVAFDDPPRNFLNAEMIRRLDEITTRVERDHSIGAVVLTSSVPEVFITHADPGEILKGAQSAPIRPTYAQARIIGGVVRAMNRVPGLRVALARSPMKSLLTLQRLTDLTLRWNRMDKVFIAAVNGLAIGGGCIIALACDLRLMADGNGVIGVPEPALGFSPAAGAVQRTARLLGTQMAVELLLEGRLLDPREARDAGLVHQLIPPEELLDQAQRRAKRIAARPPKVIAEVKRGLYGGLSRPLAVALRAEEASMAATVCSAESEDGLGRLIEGIGPVAQSTNRDVLDAWRPLIERDRSVA